MAGKSILSLMFEIKCPERSQSNPTHIHQPQSNMKMHPHIFLTLAILLGMTASSPTATIAWKTPTTISGDSDVSTNGHFERAYNMTHSSFASPVVVNGVNFDAFAVPSGSIYSFTSGNTTVSKTTGLLFSGLGSGATVAPFSSLGNAYQTILGQVVRTDGNMTLTLNSLTVGNTYELQLWTNTSNPTNSNGFTATAGNSVVLDSNTTNASGGVGQFVLGSFTADATSQTISFTANVAGLVDFTAFQLRTTPMVFSVRDYGAIPNDEYPDGANIRACIQAALSSRQHAEIVFETGSYRIDALTSATSVGEILVSLPILGASNLSLRGSPGTTLVFTDPSAGGIVLDGCRNIRIQDLRIDYDTLPYASGTIRAVNVTENTFDLELDAGSADFANPLFAKAKALWGIVVRPDMNAGTTRYGPVAVGSKSFAPVQGRVWRLTVSSEAGGGYPNSIVNSGMKPGDRYVHMARTYGSAVGIQSCSDVQIDGVTVLSSPGLSFFPYRSRGVSLFDCHVSPGPNRLISSNADGIHARGLRGNLLVDSCSFEGMGDDAINIHSSVIRVNRVFSSTNIFADPSTYGLKKDDELVAYDATTMKKKGRTTVREWKVSGYENEVHTVPKFEISFTDPIEGLQAGDRLYNLSEAGNPFDIRNCDFLSHRGRAIVVSAVEGVIQNNFFANNEGWGVDLTFGDPIWVEGPPAQQLQITGNTFLGRGGIEPCIVARSTSTSSDTSERFFKELVIEKNTFQDLPASAIRLSRVDGASISDNSITGPLVGIVGFPAIELENSAGLFIEKMNILDARIKTGVLIRSNVAAGEAGVKFGLSDHPLTIIDER